MHPDVLAQKTLQVVQNPAHCQPQIQVSNEKKVGCSGSIRDYTTQSAGVIQVQYPISPSDFKLFPPKTNIEPENEPLEEKSLFKN